MPSSTAASPRASRSSPARCESAARSSSPTRGPKRATASSERFVLLGGADQRHRLAVMKGGRFLGVLELHEPARRHRVHRRRGERDRLPERAVRRVRRHARDPARSGANRAERAAERARRKLGRSDGQGAPRSARRASCSSRSSSWRSASSRISRPRTTLPGREAAPAVGPRGDLRSRRARRPTGSTSRSSSKTTSSSRIADPARLDGLNERWLPTAQRETPTVRAILVLDARRADVLAFASRASGPGPRRSRSGACSSGA